jgi:hypothetical protein
MTNFNLDTPCTIYGYIKTANLLTPEYSLGGEQYNLTLLLEDPSVEQDLEMLFGTSRTQAPHLRHDWRGKFGAGEVTLRSLLKPRVRRPEDLLSYEELPQYTFVSVDLRPMLQELEGTDYETLVLISVNAVFQPEPSQEIIDNPKYGALEF